MDIIDFRSIRKIYKNGKQNFLAIDDINFSIKQGEIIGLVGPNGAGKSTIVKLLCGILSPTEGTVEVIGVEPHKNRKKLALQIGVMFGNRSSLWYNLPAIESVLLIKDIYNIENSVFEERLKKYSDMLQITSIINKPVRQMSLGQRIRLELLVTVLHNPVVLILDEPTLGLDVVAKLQFREMLTNLAKDSKTTVVLTTHDLGDVEKVCHRILLINKGKKLIDLQKDKFEELIEKFEVVYVDYNFNYNLNDFKFLREQNEQWYKFIVPVEKKKEFIEELMDISHYQLKFKVEKCNLEDILYEYYN